MRYTMILSVVLGSTVFGSFQDQAVRLPDLIIILSVFQEKCGYEYQYQQASCDAAVLELANTVRTESDICKILHKHIERADDLGIYNCDLGDAAKRIFQKAVEMQPK